MSIPQSEPSPNSQIEFEDPQYSRNSFDWVRGIHTLGPNGTNCERAAISWITRKCPHASVVLHCSLETAAEAVKSANDSVLLGVVAYPRMHSLIYSHLECLQLIDVFIAKTDYMVMASATGAIPKLCATHPAPEKLLPAVIGRRFVTNNVDAAKECADGLADGCLTTLCAAEKHGLKVVRNFGQIPMAFTIHGPMSVPTSARTDAFQVEANICERRNLKFQGA
jgi:hypothetical protein